MRTYLLGILDYAIACMSVIIAIIVILLAVCMVFPLGLYFTLTGDTERRAKELLKDKMYDVN